MDKKCFICLKILKKTSFPTFLRQGIKNNLRYQIEKNIYLPKTCDCAIAAPTSFTAVQTNRPEIKNNS